MMIILSYAGQNVRGVCEYIYIYMREDENKSRFLEKQN
jgi:hypothetical protein